MTTERIPTIDELAAEKGWERKDYPEFGVGTYEYLTAHANICTNDGGANWCIGFDCDKKGPVKTVNSIHQLISLLANHSCIPLSKFSCLCCGYRIPKGTIIGSYYAPSKAWGQPADAFLHPCNRCGCNAVVSDNDNVAWITA